MDIEQEQFESHTSIHYSFSLKSILEESPAIEANFSPLLHKKTAKLIKVIPTYRQNSDVAFLTEMDQLTLKRTQSENVLADQLNRTPQHIYVPKPVSNFCQVCRQRYTDYLQHVAHPVHKKNSEKSNSQFSIESLKEILDQSQNRSQSSLSQQKRNPSQSSLVSCSSQSGTPLEGNHNSSIMKEEKETDRVSIESGESRQEINQIPSLVKRRGHRKFSNFKLLSLEQKQEPEGMEAEF